MNRKDQAKWKINYETFAPSECFNGAQMDVEWLYKWGYHMLLQYHVDFTAIFFILSSMVSRHFCLQQCYQTMTILIKFSTQQNVFFLLVCDVFNTFHSVIFKKSKFNRNFFSTIILMHFIKYHENIMLRSN